MAGVRVQVNGESITLLYPRLESPPIIIIVHERSCSVRTIYSLCYITIPQIRIKTLPIACFQPSTLCCYSSNEHWPHFIYNVNLSKFCVYRHLVLLLCYSCAEGAPQQMLTVMAGEQGILFPMISNPDDEIALQDDRTFRLGLLSLEEFEDRINVGGQNQTDPQTFANEAISAKQCAAQASIYQSYCEENWALAQSRGQGTQDGSQLMMAVQGHPFPSNFLPFPFNFHFHSTSISPLQTSISILVTWFLRMRFVWFDCTEPSLRTQFIEHRRGSVQLDHPEFV